MNLYGPIVVQGENTKRDLNNVDLEQQQPSAPLIDPPPLPPRSVPETAGINRRMLGRISFHRQRSGSDGTVTLELPSQDPLRRRSSQRGDIHIVRKALRNRSSRVSTKKNILILVFTYKSNIFSYCISSAYYWSASSRRP